MKNNRITGSPLTVFVLFLVVYLLTLTSNFTAPHDSMAYLNMLRKEEGLFHPHHLLYHVTSKYWLNFWKGFFPGTPDYLLVESYSAVWGAAVVAMVFQFFKVRFALPVAICWTSTIVAGMSYAIWFYSVNVEVYMPSLFFTILSLYILTRSDWTSREIWQISVTHSLAILFHQMNILLVPVVLYKIYIERKNIYVFKAMFWYGVTGLVLVGGMYFVGGWLIEGHDTMEEWIGWIRGYTGEHQYWQPLTWKTPFHAFMGFARTVIGAQFIFQFTYLNEFISSFLDTHQLHDEAFLVRNLSDTTIIIAICCTFAVASIMIYLLVHFLRYFRIKMKYFGEIITPMLLYIGIYSLYFFFWMPEILEFWMGHCIICWLLLLGTYGRSYTRLQWISGLLALCLFVTNYFTSIRPMQEIENDIGYSRIGKLRQSATEKDLVIVEDPWLVKDFLEYYSKARVRVIPKPDEAFQEIALKQDIDSTLKYGDKVFLIPATHTERIKTNKQFIPGLKKEFDGRVEVFQEELAVIYLIR